MSKLKLTSLVTDYYSSLFFILPQGYRVGGIIFSSHNIFLTVMRVSPYSYVMTIYLFILPFLMIFLNIQVHKDQEHDPLYT